MKDKLFKKRHKVDWDSLRLMISDHDVDVYFWTHFNGRSTNRLSYQALLHKFGKARLDAYRATGLWSLDNV